MFGQFSEQMQKSSKPASELLAVNIKAIEAATTQHTEFFSNLMSDSVKLMQTIAQQTEMKGIIAAQSVYAESLRERLASSSKNTYNTLNVVSKQYTDALKSSLETQAPATAATEKATVKKAAVKKASVKKAAPKKVAVTKVAVAKAQIKKAAITAKPVASLSADEVKAPAKTTSADVKTATTPTTKA
jgi:hypothetical protein